MYQLLHDKIKKMFTNIFLIINQRLFNLEMTHANFKHYALW